MVFQNNGLDNPVTGSYEEGMDSLKHQEHQIFSNDMYYSRLVREAAHYYDQMRDLRKKWTRANDYFMGRQLNDEVVFNGRKITVSDYLKIRGLPEFQNDIISDKVLTLKGILRQENMAATCKATDSNEDMTAAIFSEFLRVNDNLNRRQALNAEFFQEFAVYAFLCAKVSHDYREGRDDIYVDKQDIFKMALPTFEKADLSDVHFIAEAHDMDWPDLLSLFGVDDEGNASEEAEKALQNIYARETEYIQGYRQTGFNQSREGDDFYHSTMAGKYRVIEIWKEERNRALWCHDYATADVGFRPLSDKAAIDAENERRKADNVMRDENGVPLLDADGNQQYYVAPEDVALIKYKIKIEKFWYYRFISPNGYLLAEGASPYKVLRDGYSFRYHPYVFLAYPCLQGETRSFIDRVIDKQRSTNHYLLMFDSLMGHAMKGMAIDAKSVSKYQGLDEMIAEAKRPDGVVVYDGSKGNAPSALTSSVTIPSGLEWLINQNQSIVVSQSGVQGALQGVHRNTSGKQYQMEREAASTTVADYFGAFYDFSQRVSKVQLWEIQQFYDSHRSVKLTGEDYKQFYNPDTMMDVNFDLQLDMDANSAVMRAANNDMLWQLMLQNRIDIITMLDCGSWTNTARLKKRIQEYQQAQMQVAAQTGQAPQVGQDGAAHLQNGDNGGQMPQPTVGTGGVSA